MTEEQLIDRVIAQIKKEVYENDFTAIGGLLDCLTTEQLERYLPEDDEQPVRFQVISYRKPEAERKTFQDHGGEWHFFDSAEEAEDFTLKLERDGYWPEGDRWVVSALDRNDCCLDCWEVPIDEEDAA